MKTGISVFAFCLLVSVSSGQEALTRVYKTRDGKELKLDIYSPPGDLQNKKPVMVLFHGGGLVNGNKEQWKSQCQYFAQKGFVAVSANYHLLPKGDSDANTEVPQCIKDAKSAVRWVKAHATELNIDTSRLVLGGGSAGAFLATQAALNREINESTDDTSISTTAYALILYNPAYIPVKKYGPDVTGFLSKKTPPSVLIYGSEDNNFKPGGDNFYNHLNKLGVRTELWVAEGQKHGFYNQAPWGDASNRKAYNFLLKTGIITGKPEKDQEEGTLIFQSPQKN